MKVAIHQSQYLPWPPYFRKMAVADKFILMDSVQYQKNGVQNRNMIRNKEGGFWLTIPVTGHLSDTIALKALAEPRWAEKHWKSVTACYAKAPAWPRLEAPLRSLYAKTYRTLGEVNDAFLDFLAAEAGVTTPRVRLSTLKTSGAGSDLVLSACRAVGADTYVSGHGAKDYLDEAAFAKAGVRIEYVESKPPEYAQFHGGAFVPGLSMLDMLFNLGSEGCRAWVSGGAA